MTKFKLASYFAGLLLNQHEYYIPYWRDRMGDVRTSNEISRGRDWKTVEELLILAREVLEETI